jgi:hypothetical protein
MRTNHGSSCRAGWLLGGLLVFALGTAASAGEPAAPEMTPEQQAMMEAMAKAGALGEQHAWLATLAGSWTFTGTFWMGPEGPPTTSSGTAERTLIHGGRVLVETVRTEFEGQPFEGQGMTGFDNVTKRWWSTWTDTMSTGLMTSVGTCREGRCEFEMTGPDPLTGGMSSTRGTSEHNGDRELHTSWAKGPDGKEWKTMELVYTRKK